MFFGRPMKTGTPRMLLSACSLAQAGIPRNQAVERPPAMSCAHKRRLSTPIRARTALLQVRRALERTHTRRSRAMARPSAERRLRSHSVPQFAIFQLGQRAYLAKPKQSVKEKPPPASLSAAASSASLRRKTRSRAEESAKLAGAGRLICIPLIWPAPAKWRYRCCASVRIRTF